MSCDDSDKNIKKKHPSFLHLLGPLLGDFVTKYQPLETPKLKNPASGQKRQTSWWSHPEASRVSPQFSIDPLRPGGAPSLAYLSSVFSCMFNVIHSQLLGKTPPEFGHHTYFINQPNCHKKMPLLIPGSMRLSSKWEHCLLEPLQPHRRESSIKPGMKIITSKG